MRVLRTPRLLLAGAIAAALVAAVAIGGGNHGARAASSTPDAQSAAACKRLPATLSLRGRRPGRRFTMLLRISKREDVLQYVNIHRRIRNRDVFVVNTRHSDLSRAEQTELVTVIRRNFPCNRIIALNGLTGDPDSPRFAGRLVDDPRIFGVLLDFERRDWANARAFDGRLPRWKGGFKRALFRIKNRVRNVLYMPGVRSEGKPVGVAPHWHRKWHYGKIARAVNRINRRAIGRRGFVSVQTQATCKFGRVGKWFEGRIGRLLRRYSERGVSRRNLSVQISFTNSPRRKARLPVRSVSPGKAAKCTRAALRRGAGAFFYWAKPAAVAALLRSTKAARLR